MTYVPDPGGDVFGPGDAPHGICVSFSADTMAADPTWTRLDDPVGYALASGFSISRGRQTFLDKTGTGSASVTFLDRDGLLDPTNPDSPFDGEITPVKQMAIALMNPVTGDWSTLYRGYISGMQHSLDMWSATRGLDTITMDCVDAFDLFGALELTPGQHGYTTPYGDFADVYYQGTPANFNGQDDVFVHVDDRLVKLLDDASWPNTGQKRNGMRNIFSGNVSLQGVVYSRRDSILQALFDCADAEFPGVANLFMSKDGIFTFHGRFARFFPTRPGYGINHWYAGGLSHSEFDDTIAPIAGLEFRMSQEDIINACVASPQHAIDSDMPGLLVKDTTSIGKYGWRSLTFDNLLIDRGHDDAGDFTTAKVETKKFASYYVDNFSVPQSRVTQITFRPRGSNQIGASALWDLMCGVEIGDLITLYTDHPGGFGGFANDFFVEGIHYDAAPMRPDIHDITLELDVTPRAYYDSNPFGSWDDS